MSNQQKITAYFDNETNTELSITVADIPFDKFIQICAQEMFWFTDVNDELHVFYRDKIKRMSHKEIE